MDPNELHLASYRRDLRSRNRSPRTIHDYLSVLGDLIDAHPGVDVMDLDPAALRRYMGSLLDRMKASSAGIHYRSLRAFYGWAEREQIIDRSPMAGMEEPKPTDEPIPVLPDDAVRALLRACAGTDFESRRDQAIIRLWCEPGSPRVAEMAGLTLEDLDLKHDQVTVRGKGDKVRIVPFGAKTGQAIDRYLRVRAKHTKAKLPELWIGGRGMGLTPSGLTQMLRRRARQAGTGHVHPHQLRHTAAHNWADAGGSEADSMVLFGWSSPEMPRRYGRSAQEDRARRSARRASIADRF